MTSLRGSAASNVGYRRKVLALGPIRIPLRVRSIAVGLSALGALCILGVLSLGLGTYPLTPLEVVNTLLGGGAQIDRTVVIDWRLPRATAAITIGAILGIAGALFQTVTRNPLASPDILGLSNGAFTGMLLALILVSGSWPVLTTGALLGGFATALLIWALAARGGIQGFRLIVVGIGVAAILASINTWMLLQIELETAMFASAWGTGSLNGVTAGPLAGALLCALPFVLLAFALVPRLRQLSLGDDMAAATGARPSAVRAFALLTGVVLVAAATTVAGPIAFVSLAAPQISRLIARTPHLSLMLSGLIGGVLLLGADLIAQHVLPTPLPVGVVTVSVGGAYLVLMIVLEIRRRA
ncbi:FecCD family ABC transporter permease [Humidisolicoccus flavus]|uniref:FecCD family ABC transporter permease n=1 Tax=Humidisolicoccus flavus TaxID=3111414 RepID=UPI003254FF19